MSEFETTYRVFCISFRLGDGGMTIPLIHGDTVYHRAVLTAPPEYAGQVRDITKHTDGSWTLGPDQSRRAPAAGDGERS